MIETDEIVSAAWLKKHLEDPQVVIIDCRFSLADPDEGQKQYETGHIPGAYYLDLNKDLSSPVGIHGGRHPLPNPAKLASKLEEIGVWKDETLVLAYDDSRLAFAARLWWLLRYLGHDRVAVLNGGLAGWLGAGYPVTDGVSPPRTGTFVPQVRSEWVVDIEAVKARKDLPGVVLVDSRDRDRYQGLREPIDPIAGHIPGAVNFPWKEVTDADGFVQAAVETSAGWFLMLDTVEQGKGWGSYCAGRRDWLRRSLEDARGRPVYLFMHHPPFHVGIPSLDRLGLGADGDCIGEVLSVHDNVRHLFFGHVHRPIAGSWRGIPYSTLRGTNHQVPLDFDAVEVVPKSHEPPAYALVFLEDDQTTVHFHDYLDTYRVPYDKRSEGRPDWG